MKSKTATEKKFDIRILLSLLPLTVVLVSCGTYNMRAKFDETAKSYGVVARWDKYETASVFAASSIRDEFEKRLKNAKDLEVVEYRVINVDYDAARLKATVNVQISYFLLPSTLVKTVIDKQVWQYVDEGGSRAWRLTSLPPEFK